MATEKTQYVENVNSDDSATGGVVAAGIAAGLGALSGWCFYEAAQGQGYNIEVETDNCENDDPLIPPMPPYPYPYPPYNSVMRDAGGCTESRWVPTNWQGEYGPALVAGGVVSGAGSVLATIVSIAAFLDD